MIEGGREGRKWRGGEWRVCGKSSGSHTYYTYIAYRGEETSEIKIERKKSVCNVCCVRVKCVIYSPIYRKRRMTCSTIRIWEEDVHHVRARIYRTQHQVRDDTQERTRKKLPKKNHGVVMWS